MSGTQVTSKRAPTTGEGAHKTPSEMTGDAATKAATTLVAFLAEHNAPIPAGDKPMRLDKEKARAPTDAAIASLVSLGGKNGKPSSRPEPPRVLPLCPATSPWS